jgi:hypothetical protein
MSFAPRAAAQTGEIPRGGAFYEYRRWHCEVSGDGFRETVSEKITILNERGQKFARLSFRESGHHRLKSVSIKVRDAAGKVIYQRNKGDLAKTCGYDRIAIYEDNCRYDGTFQAQVYPYSVEYESVTQSESLFFLVGAVFQSTIPVLSAEYTVVNAKNLALRYKS